MRFVILIFIASIAILSKGVAAEKLTRDIRVNLKSENLSINEEGIFLITDDLGLVALNNLQLDERGYYTICQIAYVCANCSEQLAPDSNECVHCGAQEIVSIGVGENENNKYLTAQAILTAFLGNPAEWEGKILLCGHVKMKGGLDDDGDKSLTIKVTETDDHNNDYSAIFKVEEEKGKITTSTEVEVKHRGENDVDYSTTFRAKEENGKITTSVEVEVDFDF